MDRWRWTGVLSGAALGPGGPHFRVAASLCVSSASGALAAPSANAVFFTGDRVEGTGNATIEELSDSANIARLVASKLGGRGNGGEAVAINAWVVDAATFSGPFAVYREFVPSVDSHGNPARYDAEGFPASTSIVALLSNCVRQVRFRPAFFSWRLPSSNPCSHLSLRLLFDRFFLFSPLPGVYWCLCVLDG